MKTESNGQAGKAKFTGGLSPRSKTGQVPPRRNPTAPSEDRFQNGKADSK